MFLLLKAIILHISWEFLRRRRNWRQWNKKFRNALWKSHSCREPRRYIEAKLSLVTRDFSLKLNVQSARASILDKGGKWLYKEIRVWRPGKSLLSFLFVIAQLFKTQANCRKAIERYIRKSVPAAWRHSPLFTRHELVNYGAVGREMEGKVPGFSVKENQ